eukprot:12789583-Alexandrium_andersonii.AAC.1
MAGAHSSLGTSQDVHWGPVHATWPHSFGAARPASRARRDGRPAGERPLQELWWRSEREAVERRVQAFGGRGERLPGMAMSA